MIVSCIRGQAVYCSPTHRRFSAIRPARAEPALEVAAEAPEATREAAEEAPEAAAEAPEAADREAVDEAEAAELIAEVNRPAEDPL